MQVLLQAGQSCGSYSISVTIYQHLFPRREMIKMNKPVKIVHDLEDYHSGHHSPVDLTYEFLLEDGNFLGTQVTEQRRKPPIFKNYPVLGRLN